MSVAVETEETTHSISVRPIGAMDGGKWFAAYCSCGSYRSGRYASPERALEAGGRHVRAKEGKQ